MRSWMWLPLETQEYVHSRNGTCQHESHLPTYFATKAKFSIKSGQATDRSKESLGHRFYSNAITKRKKDGKEMMPAPHITGILKDANRKCYWNRIIESASEFKSSQSTQSVIIAW